MIGNKKTILTKILSLVTAFAVLIPIILSPIGYDLKAYADEPSDDIATYDAWYEYEHSCAKAGQWYVATKIDGFAYNSFHNEVQRYIRDVNPEMGRHELPIKFKEPTLNPVTGKLCTEGSADLYMVVGSTTYLWEVKPASYLVDDGINNRKSKGEQQLQNYIDTNINYENGGLCPPFIGTFDMYSPTFVKYHVEFISQSNGLILYWFERFEEDDGPDEPDDSSDGDNDKKTDDSKKDEEEDEDSSQSDENSSKPKVKLDKDPVIPPVLPPKDNDENPEAQGVPADIQTSDSEVWLPLANRFMDSAKINALALALAAAGTGNNRYFTSVDKSTGDLTIMYIEGEITIADFADGICMIYGPGIFNIDFGNIDTNTKIDLNDYKIGGSNGDYIGNDNDNVTGTGNTQDTDRDDGSEITFLGEVRITADDFVEDFFDFWRDKFGGTAKNDIGGSDSKTDTAGNTTHDPIILDLNSDGYDINTKKSGAYFDLNCDSFAERINWTTTDGILAVDKNSNGTIDDGNEVFGDSFVMGNGQKAANGFEALASFDENGDGFIDSKDWIYSRLLIWVDANGNGKSEKDELTAISDNNITRICLTYETINELTDSEAIIGNESYYEYKDGSTNKIGEMWVSSDLYDALETICAAPTEEIAGLPNVRSFGKVHSLHYAMTNDETGRLKTLVQAFDSETDHDKRTELVKEILSILCDTDAVDSSSRGSNIDAKHLAVIEAVLGKGFVGTNGANPNPNAAIILEEVYNNIVNTYYHAMISSRVYTYISKISETETANGTVNYDLTTFNYYVVKQLSKNAIDNATFVDVCDYLNYFSKVMQGNNSLLIEFMDYVGDNAEDYLPLVYNSLYDSIKGTPEADELHGTDSDDLIFADDGDDSILAGNGNDCILGHDGDDTIYGGNGNDTIDGGKGNDVLYGGYGNDTINGKAGDDQLEGGSGNDIYVFGIGYGNDTVYEDDYYDTDTVCFGKGLTKQDMKLDRDGNDLIISFNGHSDTLRIKGQYSSRYHIVEKFEFADGSAATSDELFGTSLTIKGSGKIEDFTGGFGTRDTSLVGSDSDDNIYGYSGNDTLDGGKGDDYLAGGNGNDVYLFGIGYGNDTIYEDDYYDTDTVRFGKGLSKQDMKLDRDGNDLIISFNGHSDTLRIKGQYSSRYHIVEKFEFADGSAATSDELFGTSLTIKGSGKIEDFTGGFGTRDTSLVGSDSDDSIYGYSGNDTLDGRKGDDYLAGGNGNDVYLFGIGYGNDTVYEDDYYDSDTVRFGEGLNREDMHLSREGNDLVITFKGIDDTIRIKEQFSNRYHIVESFEFADGITVTSDELYSVPLVIKGKGTIKDFTSGYGNRSSILIGSDEEDTIYAYDGNDTLDGGSGNDKLYGGNGNDVYLFGEGYGSDTIYEDDYYDNDTVRFGKGLEKEDMQLNREGNDLIISFKGHDDTLRIDQMYYSRYHIVETFEFADGTVVTSDELFNTSLTITGSEKINDFTDGFGTRDTTLIGSDKNDSIYGYGGNDTLDGKSGDDYLEGGNGDDVYLFGIDSGNDSVYEDDYYDTDTVLFGEGLKYEDIQLNREGNDLIISFKGNKDTLRIIRQYENRYHVVEAFVFSDGTSVTSDDLFNTSLTIKGSGTIKDFTGGYGTRNTSLVGSDSDDCIYGYGGNDTLDGGSGNDQLYGGNGNDVYLFGEGYGSDTIYEDDYYDNDTVRFGKGLEKKDMQLNREGNDLIISFKGHNNSLRIDQMYYSRYHIVETFEFADGTVVTSNDLFSTTLTVTSRGEIKDFTGGFGTRDAKLLGSDNDDSLYGYSGNDTLDGGKGDDYLAGGNGNDVYLFGIDSGNDTIYEDDYYDTDTVRFGERLYREDMKINREGNDLIISFSGQKDTLRIKEQYSSRYHIVEKYEFADGSVVTSDDLFGTSLIINESGTIEDFTGGFGTRDTSLVGSDEDDSIYGYGGNDTLDGGKGNDYLAGGNGNDVYLFGIGSGNDTVYEDDYYDTDIVRFGSGIKSSEIEIRRDGNDLVLAVSGSEDSIRIKDYFISRYHMVEVFEFSDGTVAEMDTGTMSFNIKVYGTDFDEEADEPVVDTNEESSLEIVTNNEKSEQKEAA